MRLSGSLRFLLSLTAVLVLFTGQAEAAAGRDYGLAIRALMDEKYERAEEKIREALEDESQAKESILISGATRYRYLPYYVLGAALRGQGRCPEALEAWRESIRQGQVQQANEFAERKRARWPVARRSQPYPGPKQRRRRLPSHPPRLQIRRWHSGSPN